jgi:CubicO group peptidase (beta-lactamase class C family)
MKVVSLGEDGQPKYEDQTRPMTIEDLLLHRSGMAYGIFGGNPIEDAWAGADLFNPQTPIADNMDKMPALPLLGQPGEQWFYSYSIDILGRIAEVVTGQTLGEALSERFFDPLGMSETSFTVPAERKARFASNYMLQADGSFVLAEDGQTSPFTMPGKFQSGGGGLTSTTDDWLKFARMLLDEGEFNGTQILEPATVRLMMTDHLGDTPPLLPWLGGDTGAGFGYGGSVQLTSTPEQETTKGRYPGQFGWGGAARTNFWVDPENGAIGIIMLQFFSPEDPQLHDDFQAMALAQTRNDKD